MAAVAQNTNSLAKTGVCLPTELQPYPVINAVYTDEAVGALKVSNISSCYCPTVRIVL